jgi:FkbM family methyltransferase
MQSNGIEVIKKRESGLTFSEEYDMIYEYNSQKESDYIYEEIFIRQIYLKHDIIIKSNDTIIDCGANIGLFSLFCIKHVKNINILCIEPLPPNHTLLKRNLSDYVNKKNLDYDIKLCNCAVGRYEEECNFHFFSDVPGESTRHLLEHQNQREILFDSALKSENIEILEGLLDGNDNNDNNDNDNNDNDNNKNNNDNNNKNDNDNNHNNNNDNSNDNICDNGDDNNDDSNDNLINDKNENNDLLPVSEGEIYLCKIRTLEDIFIEYKYLSIDLLKVRICAYYYLYGCIYKFILVVYIICIHS